MKKVAALSLGLSWVPIAAGFSPAAWTTTTTTTTSSSSCRRPRRGRRGLSTSSFSSSSSYSSLRYASSDDRAASSPPLLFRDFYSLLDVSRTATSAEIKSAYRKLAKRYHPDANPGRDTTAEFQAINRAYEILFDAEGRKKYDATLSTSRGGVGGGGRHRSTNDFAYGGGGRGGPAPPPPPPPTPPPSHRRPPSFQRTTTTTSSTDRFRRPHASPSSANAPNYYEAVIENFNRRPPSRPTNDATSSSSSSKKKATVDSRESNNEINEARMRAKEYDPVNDFIKTKSSTSPTGDNGKRNANDDVPKANGFRRPFQSTTSTDQFKRPHVSPPSANAPNYYKTVIENFDSRESNNEINEARMRAKEYDPVNDFIKTKSSTSPTGDNGKRNANDDVSKANGFRHPFQSMSTDQFKMPHVSPPSPDAPDYYRTVISNFNNGGIPRPGGVAPADRGGPTTGGQGPRSRSTIDDGDDVVAEDRPYSKRPTPSYAPTPRPVPVAPPAPSHSSTQRPARVIPEGAASAVTPEEYDLRSWDEKLETAQSLSPRTLLRGVRWPLLRDPPGDGPDFPIAAMRVGTTALAALSTRYLHLICGNSPVLAASATTMLVSTCLDRRLGRAALCGSLAGMSGGHLTPTLSAAVALAGLSSMSYELLINTNDACRGIGGRLGAAAFLATSVLAKYQGVRYVGRKLRRGLWKGGAGPSIILSSMILYHVLGAVVTICLREYSDDSAAADPVRASSVVGLLGSLFLRDPTAILALYGGSFVGMSLPSRLMHGNAPGKDAMAVRPQRLLSLFGSFAGAGALAGLFHAMTIRYGYWNGGWGGKAGLCAFAGCWAYRGFGNAVDFVRSRRKK
ncbi:hypothetical protein ACHAW5_004852 [Stephanodiscus triporus]|uniref:J domain-containing protein n=1 Tax=Stephanodiscus triporus TaxID=2934178 RepID=A0ABD3NDI7_9STRA